MYPISSRRILTLATVVAAALSVAPSADAFCGMYVAGAGKALYNSASQVAIVRDNGKTTITMENDYAGEPNDFALVVPVPVVLKKKDVRTVAAKLFNRLDTFSAPRLVEYYEQDPCTPFALGGIGKGGGGIARKRVQYSSGPAKRLGVTVEEKFDVEEYNIVILSATESDGLETWLKQNGYSLPDGAATILAPYVKRQSKFFAAKVDAKKLKRDEAGKVKLTPLQFTFEAPSFELPIRLGMVNSKGLQDLIIYAITANERVAVVNYPNIFIPTDMELGDKLKEPFGEFYLKLFSTAQDEAGGAAVLTEYAWSTNHCDPCPSPVLRPDELRALGLPGGRGVITRLHARYHQKLFKDDLILGLTKHDRNFQGRYILRHPWEGEIKCENPVRGQWGAGKPKSMGGNLPTTKVGSLK